MINSLRIQQFRNHNDRQIDFVKSNVLITGRNTRGKTSLLEALYLGLRGVGFRNSDDFLIQHSKDWARVDLVMDSDDRTVKLIREGDNLRKQHEKSGQIHKKLLTFREGGSVVLFEPDELRMLSGPPELRRAWLDNLIITLEPRYEIVIKHYLRALKQRNRLLKQPSVAPDQYFVWELKLGEYGEQITHLRTKIIGRLNESITRLYTQISKGDESISVIYDQPHGSYSAWLVHSLQIRREHDQRIGYTTVGPHREDFVMTRNHQPLSTTGSRGEIRSAVIALKLFEIEIIEKTLAIKPILLLDDVLGELDAGRQGALLNSIIGCQTFITTTELLPATLSQLGHDTQTVAL